MTDAFLQYDREVKDTAFPDEKHEFHKMTDPEVLEELEKL